MVSKNQILSFVLILFTGFSYAQNPEAAIKKSKDYIYEANELVEDDFVSAEKEYRKAISKAPNYAVGSYNLANALYESELYDEAYLKLFEAAKNASTKEERHKAYHNAGNVLMKQELCEEAIEMFKNALRNNPNDDESRYNLALAKECAKNQGGGEGDDDNEDKKEDQQEQQDQNQDQQDEGENEDDNKNEGDDQQDQNEGDDKEDENGKPQDEKDNNQDNNPSDKKKKQQQQPGKLSPQQVKNLLEAMNNQEKKVQEKINAKKTKGTKVNVEKDW